MSHKYYFHNKAACSLAVKYLCISYMVSITIGIDELFVGVWKTDLIIIFIIFFDFPFYQFVVTYTILHWSYIFLLILISQIFV